MDACTKRGHVQRSRKSKPGGDCTSEYHKSRSAGCDLRHLSEEVQPLRRCRVARPRRGTGVLPLQGERGKQEIAFSCGMRPCVHADRSMNLSN